MVRRWSYINAINSSYAYRFDSKRQSTFSVTVKSTMYFRKPYSVPTVLSRRRWARRKHLYSWLPLSNIIKSWAQTYRFMRNYLKSVMRSHLFRSSFIAFNLVSLKNLAPASYKGFETIALSSTSRKTLRYFSTKLSPRMTSLLHFKNANLAFLSLNGELSDVSQHFDTSYAVPLLVDDMNYKSDVTYLPSSTNTHSLAQIQALLTRAVNSCFQSVLGLYRVLVLLTLVRLKNFF